MVAFEECGGVLGLREDGFEKAVVGMCGRDDGLMFFHAGNDG